MSNINGNGDSYNEQQRVNEDTRINTNPDIYEYSPVGEGADHGFEGFIGQNDGYLLINSDDNNYQQSGNQSHNSILSEHASSISIHNSYGQSGYTTFDTPNPLEINISNGINDYDGELVYDVFQSELVTAADIASEEINFNNQHEALSYEYGGRTIYYFFEERDNSTIIVHTFWDEMLEIDLCNFVYTNQNDLTLSLCNLILQYSSQE